MSNDTAEVDVGPAPAPPEPAATKPARLPLWANPRIGLIVLLVVLVVLFSALRPAFLNTQLTLVPIHE